MSSAGTSSAHPFGPPPTARIWAEGDVVVVDWTAAPDDTAAVGVQLGLLGEAAVEAYLEEGPAQVAPPEADLRALSGSQELRDYLLEHIQVVHRGRRCDGEVLPIEDFVHDGASVLHRCGHEVDEVEIEITVLHDRHEAYRTFAFSRDDAEPSQAVFTTASPRHTWRFTAATGGTGAPAWSRWVGLGLLGLLVVGGVTAAEVVAARRGLGEPPDTDL